MVRNGQFLDILKAMLRGNVKLLQMAYKRKQFLSCSKAMGWSNCHDGDRINWGQEAWVEGVFRLVNQGSTLNKLACKMIIRSLSWDVK